MNILITGSSGFIGSHLIERLYNLNLNLFLSTRFVNLNNKDARFVFHEFMKHDIEYDINFIKQNNIVGCIHLATKYVKDHKSSDVKDLVNSNLLFSAYILECSTRANVKWFINTGTFWQHIENKIYNPANLYAATKQAFEAIAQYYINTNKIHFITLKLCDTYGLNDNRLKIFNIWAKAAKYKNEIDMSKGDQIIDICHISDVIEAFVKLIDYCKQGTLENQNGKCFVVKAKKRYTLRDLYDIYNKSTGIEVKINWGKIPYRDNEVMVPWEFGECVPGWNAKIDLETGLKMTYNNE